MSESTLCVKCGYGNPEGVLRCSNCKTLLNPQAPLTSEQTSEASSAIKVEVVDIAMPFWSMVVFMVKWAIASIPALIILFVVAAFILTTLFLPFLPPRY